MASTVRRSEDVVAGGPTGGTLPPVDLDIAAVTARPAMPRRHVTRNADGSARGAGLPGRVDARKPAEQLGELRELFVGVPLTQERPDRGEVARRRSRQARAARLRENRPGHPPVR